MALQFNPANVLQELTTIKKNNSKIKIIIEAKDWVNNENTFQRDKNFFAKYKDGIFDEDSKLNKIIWT